jgi:hypothetical protein
MLTAGQTLQYLTTEWLIKGRKEQGYNEWKKTGATMIKANLR